MLSATDAYQNAIRATSRRMHIRVPIRVASPGLEMGTFTPSSGELSGEDGSFANPQSVSQAISGVLVLQNLVLTFGSDFPVNFSVEISSNGTDAYHKTISGNTSSRVELSGFTAYYPDLIEITATKWSEAGKPMTISEIFPGWSDTFTEDDFTDFSVTHQADFSCLSLPYGTASLTLDNSSKRFDPRNKNGLFLSLEEGQKIPIEVGIEVNGTTTYVQLGVFYQHSDGWRTADSGMSVKWFLVDILGLLSDRAYKVPETLPVNLFDWFTDILSQIGDSFADQLIIDPSIAGLQPTCNPESIMDKTCADMIKWLCMVSGTYPRADALTGKLLIEPVENNGGVIYLDDQSSAPTMAVNDKISNITFKIGEDEILVGGNAAAAAQSVTVENPFLQIAADAVMASHGILAGYGGNKVGVTYRGDPTNEVGDKCTVEIAKRSYLSAWIVSQSIEYHNGVMADCKMTLLQSDGFMFAYSATLTGNGIWTAPRGASSIRVIIVGGGQYGGSDGGNGGNIWFGTIPANRGQRFTVYIGSGGTSSDDAEATVFGAYTSDYGKTYENGYTDAISGLVFGKPNDPNPPWHSGNGGSPGVNGATGTVILYYNLDPEYESGEAYHAGEVYAGEVDA